ncbi:MAG: M23 family metallopeptidase [Solirubrobacterales bacterium]
MFQNRICIVAIALAGCLLPASASAAGYGGLGAQGKVGVADVVCLKRCVAVRKATPGSLVKVRGVGLAEVSKVVFRGAGGSIAVDPRRSTERAVTALVPADARAGRPFVIDSAGRRSGRSRSKLFIVPRSALPTAVYPVRGPHQLWDGFGGARNHQGVDLGASCGTRLVAALPGKVSLRRFHARAGHYVALDLEGSNAEIIYMHLRSASPLRVGQTVEAGDTVGFVGATGNARGCHLHFEYWIGQAWRGGEAVDPLPYLREWEGKPAKRRARR